MPESSLTKADDWLTPAQTAKRLGLTTDRVRQLGDEGKIPVTRTPLGRLFRAEDVATFAAARVAARSSRAAVVYYRAEC